MLLHIFKYFSALGTSRLKFCRHFSKFFWNFFHRIFLEIFWFLHVRFWNPCQKSWFVLEAETLKNGHHGGWAGFRRLEEENVLLNLTGVVQLLPHYRILNALLSLYTNTPQKMSYIIYLNSHPSMPNVLVENENPGKSIYAWSIRTPGWGMENKPRLRIYKLVRYSLPLPTSVLLNLSRSKEKIF